jgi:hypothetical protein
MSQIRFKFLKFFKPILKIIGIIKMPFMSKKHIFEHFYEIQARLEPGDTILTTSKGHLSNVFNRLFNPGKYMHTGIYIGEENGIPTVVDAISEGVVKRSLPVFLADKDKVALVRPLPLTINRSQIKKSLIWLEDQIGKPYDYYFSYGDDKFYCSELNYFFYKAGNPKLPFTRFYKGSGEVRPNDFKNAKLHFFVYFEITN